MTTHHSSKSSTSIKPNSLSPSHISTAHHYPISAISDPSPTLRIGHPSANPRVRARGSCGQIYQTALRSSIARKVGPTWEISHKTSTNTTTFTINKEHLQNTHYGLPTTQKTKGAHCVGEATHALSPSLPPTTPSPQPKPISSMPYSPRLMGSPTQRNGTPHFLGTHPEPLGAKRTMLSRVYYKTLPQVLSIFGVTSPAREAYHSRVIQPPPSG